MTGSEENDNLLGLLELHFSWVFLGGEHIQSVLGEPTCLPGLKLFMSETLWV